MKRKIVCPVCHGKGRLLVKHKGFIRRYYIECHDCKASTIMTSTPDKARTEWCEGWVFGGKFHAL